MKSGLDAMPLFLLDDLLNHSKVTLAQNNYNKMMTTQQKLQAYEAACKYSCNLSKIKNLYDYCSTNRNNNTYM